MSANQALLDRLGRILGMEFGDEEEPEEEGRKCRLQCGIRGQSVQPLAWQRLRLCVVNQGATMEFPFFVLPALAVLLVAVIVWLYLWVNQSLNELRRNLKQETKYLTEKYWALAREKHQMQQALRELGLEWTPQSDGRWVKK